MTNLVADLQEIQQWMHIATFEPHDAGQGIGWADHWIEVLARAINTVELYEELLGDQL